MSTRQADKNANSYDNCITVERQKLRPNAIVLSANNNKYEEKQKYIVTVGECRKITYRRIKKGETPPKGSVIHFGKI